MEEYFKQIRQEVIDSRKVELANYPQRKFNVAESMFDRKEVIDFFLKRAKFDPAYGFMVSLLRENLQLNSSGSIYIPGGGVGGLADLVSLEFPDKEIVQVDCSKEMIKANRLYSSENPNIETIWGDILGPSLEFDNLDAVLMYGVMRYIPESKRNNLVSSWSKMLNESGVVIIGEGIAQNVIEGVVSDEYTSMKSFEKEENLFKCSLFYLLVRRYDNDSFFRKNVDEYANSNSIDVVDILGDIADTTKAKVFAKVLRK